MKFSEALTSFYPIFNCPKVCEFNKDNYHVARILEAAKYEIFLNT